MTISPRQIRAARALLGWSQVELALKAGVHKNALARLEAARTDPRMSTYDAVVKALEAHGIVFLDDDGGGEGLRIRDR
jgi:predicted transcriptional regulator